MQSRTRNSAMNLAFGTLNQFVSMILNFISRSIFIKVLGARYLGINGLFADVLMLLSLAEMGLRTSMAYTFYQPLAQGNSIKVAQLTQFYKKVYHTIALFVSVVGLGLVPFLDYLVNLDEGIPYLKIYYLFFLGDIVASYFFIYKTSVIEADQKKYVITKYQMSVNIAKIILQILILSISGNYFIYLSIQILSTIINNAIISHKATHLYPMVKEKQPKLAHEERKEIFTNMRSMFIFKLSTTSMKGTNNILMSVLFGTIWVGYYSNYYLVIASLENFVSILFMSVTASIGNVIALEKAAKRLEIFRLTQTISFILTSFTTICLALLLDDFIHIWLGEEFAISNLFLGAIILNYYLKMVTYPVLSFRQATGLYVQTRYVMLAAAVLNLILSIGFAQILGISGILYASLVAQLITYFWYEPKLLFRQFFGMGTRTYFMSILVNVLLTILVTLVLGYIFQSFNVTSWLTLVIKAFAVAGASGILVLLFYFRKVEFKLLWERSKGWVSNKSLNMKGDN